MTQYRWSSRGRRKEEGTAHEGAVSVRVTSLAKNETDSREERVSENEASGIHRLNNVPCSLISFKSELRSRVNRGKNLAVTEGE